MDDGGKKENQSKMMQVMSTWEGVEETFKVGITNLMIEVKPDFKYHFHTVEVLLIVPVETSVSGIFNEDFANFWDI